MIDIHTHIIPFVDDGSSTMDASISLLKEEISFGITDIICTPHFRRGMFESKIADIKKNFELLVAEVEKQNLNINLYLGQEIYLHRSNAIKSYFNDEYIISMNNSKYLLLEFSYTNDIDISETIYNTKLCGYKSIIAHVERYQYVDLEQIYDFKSNGAMIQVNASSIVGKSGKREKKMAQMLLKNELIDFVASDIHTSRANYYQEAYRYVVKKNGLAYANKIFNDNGNILIKKEEMI